MRVVIRVNAQGEYVEDVLLEDGKPTPRGCIEERPAEGFHSPRWTEGTWVEGKPEEEITKVLREAKVAEMHHAAVEELTPLFTSSPGAGENELTFLLAGHVVKICEALKIPVDPRLAAVVTTGEKAMQKKAEVEALTTATEVEAVQWE